MTQQINSVKLKAAAEHLEWVCQQYPDNEDVQGLYRGLQAMIEDAKAGRVIEPIKDYYDIPSRWAVSAEGMYRQYTDPNVEGAYVDFATEMEGGLTEQDRQFLAKWEAKEQADKTEENNQSKGKISSNGLSLTPEQQAIFDRVVGIVTQNDELRRRFKAANDELDKHPEGNELEYINDSDDPAAVEFRSAGDAVRAEIKNTASILKTDDSFLLSRILRAVCKNFRESAQPKKVNVSSQNNLNLTPEQQAIFDRVVEIVTQNNELRQQFKTAIEELHKQPNWDDADYMSDSDDLPAVNMRAANAAIDAEIIKTEPTMASVGIRFFSKVAIAICDDFYKGAAK
jgi:hypothetical protein